MPRPAVLPKSAVHRGRSSLPTDLAAEVEAILVIARGLHPSWTDPQKFHEQKSELMGRLKCLAHSPLCQRVVVRLVRADPLPPIIPSAPHKNLCVARRSRPPRCCYPLPPRHLAGQGFLPI